MEGKASIKMEACMAKKQTNARKNLRNYRESLGENQTLFWSRFGVTQSGGSRYESGRELPLPVAILLSTYAEGLLDDATLRKLVKTAEKYGKG